MHALGRQGNVDLTGTMANNQLASTVRIVRALPSSRLVVGLARHASVDSVRSVSQQCRQRVRLPRDCARSRSHASKAVCCENIMFTSGFQNQKNFLKKECVFNFSDYNRTKTIHNWNFYFGGFFFKNFNSKIRSRLIARMKNFVWANTSECKFCRVLYGEKDV